MWRCVVAVFVLAGCDALFGIDRVDVSMDASTGPTLTATVGDSATDVASLSFTATVPSSSNRFLIVGVEIASDVSTQPAVVTSVLCRDHRDTA